MSGNLGSVRFGRFELDVRAGALRRGKAQLHLPPQPFKVLSVLVSRPGELVTREELQHQLWNGDTFVDFEQGLNVCIRQIRAALNDSAEEPRFLETVPRRGYRFIARKIKPSPARKLDSIAVLPFQNCSRELDLQYLCDGIAESLINDLSQVRRLRVVPRATAFRFTDRADLAAVGSKLNVAAVVTGRLASLGDCINVQAELIETASESQIWGDQYNSTVSDFLSTQQDISRQICRVLRLQMNVDESTRASKQTLTRPVAYLSYLKGRYCLEKRTEEGLRRAVEYFKEAIDDDPDCALAYTGLADVYTLLGSGTYVAIPSQTALPHARAMALKAIEIDDSLAEAHTSLAFLRFRLDWEWSEAERHFNRAIILDPNTVRAHHWYAMFLAAMGRRQESISAIDQALALDPLSLSVQTAKGRILHFARRYEDAVEQFRSVLKLDSTFVGAHFNLGDSYLRQAKFEEARVAFQSCIELAGSTPVYVSGLAESYAGLGRRQEAVDMLQRLTRSPSDQYVTPISIAQVYLALGDTEHALAWQEKAYRDRDPSLVWAKVAPELDSLRSMPRFRQLLLKMQLAT